MKINSLLLCHHAVVSTIWCRWGLWDEKTNGDSETRNWMTANTKPCPKCSKLVEKNGGCNHVTCKCGQVRRSEKEGLGNVFGMVDRRSGSELVA